MWFDALTPLRWLLRGTLFLVQIVVFLPPTVLLQGSLGKAFTVGDRSLGEWSLNTWSRWTCRIFGLRPKVIGAPLDGPVLIVSNHISWADIEVLHSVAAMCFVGKAEIKNWPLCGFLASAGGTIYHQRGSHDSAADVVAQIMQRFSEQRRVALFPEGGIFPGEHIKRFHARLFRVAIEADCPVQPVMIRYLRDGRRDPELTFMNGENFVVNLLRLMGRPVSTAELRFLPAILPGDRPRKVLAEEAEKAIRDAYAAPIAQGLTQELAQEFRP